MVQGTPFFFRPVDPRGKNVNRLVITGLTLMLMALVGGLWLFLYLKSLEQPYERIKGYRVATPAALKEFLRHGDRRAEVAELKDFLDQRGVADVVPVEDLLRQGPQWLDLNLPPFAMPPRSRWDSIVETLTLVRDHLQPAIGPVIVLSGFHTDNYQRRREGKLDTHHSDFCGVDLVPASNISRKELLEELRSLHARLGPASNMGLGIFGSVHFHIDTCGFRTW